MHDDHASHDAASFEAVAEAVGLIAARHGVRPQSVRPLGAGVANHVYALGERLVLRVPRSPAFVPDLRREIAVVPLARAAGVSTPALVDVGDGADPLPLPYVVVERVPGRDLQTADLAADGLAGTYARLGRELARLHTLTRDTVGELDEVPVHDGADDPRALVDRLAVAGHLDRDAVRWLRGWLDRLDARRRPSVHSGATRGAVPARVLLHGDVADQNVLVDADGSFAALVDWGDAAWGDPAIDFAKLRLEVLPAVLAGYRAESGGAADAGWEAAALWYHLWWALGRLGDATPWPGARTWTAPPASRLLGLLRFFAAGPAEPWRSLH